MKTAVFVFLIFWMGIGVYTVKDAMEQGNKKVLGLNTKDGVKIILKSLLYGPYTRSKLLAKL